MEDALAGVRATGSAGVSILFLGDIAGWQLDRGETARARALLDEAMALGAQYSDSYILTGPLPCLALLAAMTGDPATAARALGAVEWFATGAGVVMPTHHQRRIDRAAELAQAAMGEAAYAAARNAGFADAAGFVAAMAARSRPDGCAARPASAPDPAGLSRREREVLVLMAAGHSDREIADALFISYRTATHHVRAVLAKLDARSRAEAAVRAVRAGLI